MYTLKGTMAVDADLDAINLAATVRTILAEDEDLRRAKLHEVKMFGGIGFMLNGNLLAAASKRGLLLRVGKDRQAEALARPGASLMVMRGRTLDGYVRVDPSVLNDRAVRAWLPVAVAFVRTLPPKPEGTGPRKRTKQSASTKS